MKKTCPNCKTSAPLCFQAQDVNRKISAKSFDYYKCSSCKLIFLSPIPADLGDYYPQNYYHIYPTVEELARGAEFERYKIDIVNQFVKGGKLLEIGPASGGFACLAKQAGFDVEVIEMNAKCCEFLEAKLGVRAINSHNEQEALSKLEQKNVIALWQVIEHLRDPFGLLSEACNKIQPGGILVIAAPNPDALQFRILGRHWAHVDAPRHVLLIPKNLLVEKAKTMGMKLVLATTNDVGSIGWNKFGWQFSLSNYFSNQKHKDFAFKVGGVITRLLAPFETVEGRGSAYTLVFMKE
jgi:2-polyprenyl-3-methyl-5-hydroxy-6-metoxy-1,4-benzoquinol methylase